MRWLRFRLAGRPLFVIPRLMSGTRTDEQPLRESRRPARAWRIESGAVILAGLICFASSTQLLSKRALYSDWTAAEIATEWARQLMEFAAIAAAILGTLALAGRLHVTRTWQRTLLFAGAVVAGAFIGQALVLAISIGRMQPDLLGFVAERAWRWVPVAIVCGTVFSLYRRSADMASRVHDVTTARLELERQAIESQLSILQSQIEPHFLFNTLATVRRLHQTDVASGRKALSGFIHYLRCALPDMRERTTSLGREVDLIGAYLDVLRTRMGDRLTVSMRVPQALRELAVPPLSLATLVENSIKHGLNPLPEGGDLSIQAWLNDGQLVVAVADTGVGLSGPGGGGTGLGNLRARLDALHGDTASILLSTNRPRGLVATLRVPAIRAPKQASE